MKIICIGTLDKFSRFYLDIDASLKSKTDVKTKIYSIHLSGFLHTLVRFKFSCWISLKSWLLANLKKKYYKTQIKNSITYKGIIYDEHIKFHQNLRKNINKYSLRLQALAYIDIFDKIFKKESPDFLITIGDTRLSIEIAIAIARLKNIKVFYIEQGPFNTTFFDDKGVNANISIRGRKDFNEKKTYEKKPDPNNIKESKKYRRSMFYRGMDILFMTLFEKTKIYPPDLKFSDINSYRRKRNTELSAKIEKEKAHIILLALQVPLDVNMICHSPNFKSQFDILKSVFENLPKNTKLVVREHPLFNNKYEKQLYAYIRKNNILIDNTTPLNDAIGNSKIVVVNNSTVGVEAIITYKTVVVLGNAFYDNEKVCLKLNDKEKLKSILNEAMTHKPNKDHIDAFKTFLYNTVLLKGGISDKNLVASKTIANHLLNAR